MDIHNDGGPLGIPRGRKRPDVLNPALPAEIKLRQIPFHTREIERESTKIPSHFNPAERCATLKPPLTTIVLRGRSVN